MGSEGGIALPNGRINVKNRPPFNLHFDCSILLLLRRLLLFCVFRIIFR